MISGYKADGFISTRTVGDVAIGGYLETKLIVIGSAETPLADFLLGKTPLFRKGLQ